jgi:hypothetical protein
LPATADGGRELAGGAWCGIGVGHGGHHSDDLVSVGRAMPSHRDQATDAAGPGPPLNGPRRDAHQSVGPGWRPGLLAVVLLSHVSSHFRVARSKSDNPASLPKV